MASIGSQEVCVYEADGRYKFSLDTKQGLDPNNLSQPWNVAVNADGIWYVTDCSTYVKMYSPQGVYKNRWGTLSPRPDSSTLCTLCGLTMDANGNFLVGDTSYKVISRHRQDGSQIASFKVGIAPWHLAATCTSQDTIVISDTSRLVQIVDSTGHVLHTLKQDGQETLRPWGVCVCDDIIYVCNSDKAEISCFSVSAEYIGSIAVKGAPLCVTIVEEHSRLFVVSFQFRVHIYKNTALTK